MPLATFVILVLAWQVCENLIKKDKERPEIFFHHGSSVRHAAQQGHRTSATCSAHTAAQSGGKPTDGDVRTHR
jgi:hypothetical protein